MEKLLKDTHGAQLRTRLLKESGMADILRFKIFLFDPNTHVSLKLYFY